MVALVNRSVWLDEVLFFCFRRIFPRSVLNLYLPNKVSPTQFCKVPCKFFFANTSSCENGFAHKHFFLCQMGPVACYFPPPGALGPGQVSIPGRGGGNFRGAKFAFPGQKSKRPAIRNMRLLHAVPGQVGQTIAFTP